MANIVENTIVDGEGFRTSVYVSGCDICCEDCHNKELWDIKSGQVMTVDEVYKKIANNFTNVTFIGGEPMLQASALTILAKKIKENTDKTIWIYSGHTYEEIISNEIYFSLLLYCDVLVDGKFDKIYFKNNLKFKGSSNQRIIDIKKSANTNKLILWEDEF
nr:anaerobic ribonucleoside-triphosphate reductase activating protein [Sedimentibacter sp.]